MAAVTVRIPTPLRSYTAGKDAVSVQGSNVGEVLDALEGAHPGLKDKLCDDQGRVRRFVNIFANDEDIRFLEDLRTPVDEGDEVSIVPAIAGGGR
jgi:molybdopterin synthase sulfur carrier subunit